MNDETFDEMAARFLDLFERVRAEAVAQGQPIEEYKPTETDCLRFVFSWLFQAEERGLEYLSLVIHELVWAQCLGNANHRTTLLFAQVLVEREQPALRDDEGFADHFARAFDEFADRSKKLLSRRGEIGYGPKAVKRQHLELCKRLAGDLWADQSRHLATIGAQRLIDFSVSGGHSGPDSDE